MTDACKPAGPELDSVQVLPAAKVFNAWSRSLSNIRVTDLLLAEVGSSIAEERCYCHHSRVVVGVVFEGSGGACYNY